jgi:branched-chain amino acid transport system ATP-binding protein
MLKVSGIHVYYDAIHALKGVSFVIEKGELVTLLGANGAGKTTTLKTLSGLLRPRAGSVELEGAPLERV